MRTLYSLTRMASGSRSAQSTSRCAGWGKEAHVAVSAHRLRHSCLTNLVRRGHDLVLVAEIAGHKRIEISPRNMVASQFHLRSAIRPTCSTASSTMKQSCRLPNTPPIRLVTPIWFSACSICWVYNSLHACAIWRIKPSIVSTRVFDISISVRSFEVRSSHDFPHTLG